MARMTKAERLALEQEAQLQRITEETFAYSSLLMTTLKRVLANQHVWQVEIVDEYFQVRSLERSRYDTEQYRLSYKYTPESYSALTLLSWYLDDADEKAELERAKIAARAAALAKLTKEERELLDL